jgi:hypothetical protein
MHATIQTIDDALRPFFATWTTSLMDPGLEKLRSISAEPQIRAYVETLVVQDESNTLDPFAVPELPEPGSTYRIWPRDDAGVVVASEIGITELKQILRTKLLCPRTIIIRDYRIDHTNMLLCEEYADFRNLVRKIPQYAAEPQPLAVLVRDVVDGANLNIESIVFQNVDTGHGIHSVLNSTRYREKYPGCGSVGSPQAREAIILVDPAYQGESTQVSMLRSANIKLGRGVKSYWLEQIFYGATQLKTLKLTLRTSEDQQLDAEKVVPSLEDFSLCHTWISGDDLLAMIVSSKGSLAHVTLLQVVLNHGSTWREVLTTIAKECRALESFKLCILRETDDGAPAVDFREVNDDNMPEQYRAGLNLDARGPVGNKRSTRLSYSGVDAEKVLAIIAAIGYVPESFESGKRPVREISAQAGVLETEGELIV